MLERFQPDAWPTVGMKCLGLTQFKQRSTLLIRDSRRSSKRKSPKLSLPTSRLDDFERPPIHFKPLRRQSCLLSALGLRARRMAISTYASFAAFASRLAPRLKIRRHVTRS